MFVDQLAAIFAAALAVVVLEAWRRSLRRRAPRWVHVTAVVLEIEVAVGAAYAQYEIFEATRAIETAEGADKSTLLARGVSSAMNGNAFAIAGFCLAVIVLFIGAVLARKHHLNALADTPATLITRTRT